MIYKSEWNWRPQQLNIIIYIKKRLTTFSFNKTSVANTNTQSRFSIIIIMVTIVPSVLSNQTQSLTLNSSY